MPRPSNPTKKRGYTLIELVVVLAVIAVISAATLPNLTLSSDQQRLLASANTIRQILLDARTRSLAPSKADSTGNYQIFQVGFTPFATQADKAGEDTNHFIGNEGTRTVYMEKAVGACDQEVDASSPTRLRTSTLQRNVYIKRFYPAQGQDQAGNTSAIIRFSVGKVGFVCGGASNPNFTSTDYEPVTNWVGKDTVDSSKIIPRNLYIELSTKAGRKMYVVVDRQTGETTVARTNPQTNFVATTDTEVPQWPADVDAKLDVSCAAEYSTLALSFNRARDFFSGASDDNLPVFYDIKMQDQILVLQYYWATNQDTVYFTFVTDLISRQINPGSLKFVITAQDQFSNIQTGTVNTTTSTPHERNFTGLACPTIPDPDDEVIINQFDGDGAGEACVQDGQVQSYIKPSSIYSRITRLLSSGFWTERASALGEISPACTDEAQALPQ